MTSFALPTFHVVLVALLVGTQLLYTALAVRNVNHSADRVAAEHEWLVDELSVDEPDRIVDYLRAKTGLSHLQSWLGLGILLLLLYGGIFTEVVLAIEAIGLGPIAGGVVFFLLLTGAMQAFSMPFDLVDTFVVEELFDFNTQTARSWVRDAVLGLGVSTVLTAVVIGAILGFIVYLPTLWWLAGAGFFLAFTIVMQVLYPRLIAPLFNDFERIEDGDLREAIEGVFERAGFQCEEIYTMDASRRSTHLNAYFVGFGRTKRVVLFDTLVDRFGQEEIQSVLAHELAHWKRRHIWKRLGIGTVRVTLVLFVLWYLLAGGWMTTMFGLPEAAVYAGLLVGLLFVTPVMQLSSPLVNRVSLAHEREADDFAVDVMDDPEPMADALATLASENLANPFPDPVYAAFHYSHPPIPERIRRLQSERG